jgi:opine dehydrogenase
MCIAVLGGGAIGLGTAALLIERGDQPVLWSRSGHAASLEVSGALAGHYVIPAAPSIADAVAEADAILLALPANGHRAVIDAVAPHLRVGQAAIVTGSFPSARCTWRSGWRNAACRFRSPPGAPRW